MTNWPRFAFDPIKAREALKKALVGAKCPISGDQEWTIAPGYVEIRPVSIVPAATFPAGSGKIGIWIGGAPASQDPIYPLSLVGGSGRGWGPVAAWEPAEEAAYPTVMATCKRCGYVALFNAVALGLVPPNEPGSESGHEEHLGRSNG